MTRAGPARTYFPPATPPRPLRLSRSGLPRWRRTRRPEIMPGQVDELTADLGRGQAEEVTGRGGRDRPERAVEADQGVLKNVVGLLPAVDAGILLEHLAGEPRQSVGGDREQPLTRRVVAGLEAIQPPCSTRFRSSRTMAWPQPGCNRHGDVCRPLRPLVFAIVIGRIVRVKKNLPMLLLRLGGISALPG